MRLRRLRARRGERGGRCPHLLPARRPAAGARARRRPLGSARSGGDRGAARRPLPRAPQREPRVADAAADAHGDAPVEPRPPRAGRADAVSSARGVRRWLRARARSRACAPAASSTVAGIADVLARLVEKSLVAADEGSSRERRYRLLETVRPVRARAARRGGRDARARRAARQLGACVGRAASAAHRGSIATPRTCASALDTLLERAPGDALRLCVALWPFWLRRIDLHEAQRRFDEALAAAPERTALRARALLGAAAIDFRSGALSRGLQLGRGELCGRLRDRRCARRVAGASVLGRVRSRERRGRCGDAVARASARARAA